MLWRGSTYKNHPNPDYANVRDALYYIDSEYFYFGASPVPFISYINQVTNYKVVLGMGGGGGFSCGDLCLRDIEMFGLGVPVLRPKLIVETRDELIPNHHYISVDVDVDKSFKYSNPEKLAGSIVKRFMEVKDDDDFLKEVSSNARDWYVRNFGDGKQLANENLGSLGL